MTKNIFVDKVLSYRIHLRTSEINPVVQKISYNLIILYLDLRMDQFTHDFYTTDFLLSFRDKN